MKNKIFSLVTILSLILFSCTSLYKNERSIANIDQVSDFELYSKFGSGNIETTKIYLLEDKRCQTFNETYKSGTKKAIEVESNLTQCQLLQEAYQSVAQNGSCENKKNILSDKTNSGNTQTRTIRLNNQCHCIQEDFFYRSGTTETIRTLVALENCQFSK